MLEKLDLSKKMEKEIYRSEMEKLIPRLGKLQRKCKDLNIPVMIAFEGYGAAGKGVQISKLIQALDPRGKRRKCIPFCGVFGQSSLPREELRFMIPAGTEEC